MTKTYSEQEVFTALMVLEWIKTTTRDYAATDEYRRFLEKEYPYLVMIQSAEGQYGLRRIAIEMGALIEHAFVKLPNDTQELLLHGESRVPNDGCFRGVGDYDYNLVPIMVKWWLSCMWTMEKLTEERGSISVDQAHAFMLSLIPEEVSPF